MTDTAIIIGGGSSIRQHEWLCSSKDIPIWNEIENHFTIGLNNSHRYVRSTLQMFYDYQVYQQRRTELDTLPIVIGKGFVQLLNLNPSKNIYPLRFHKENYYGKDAWDEQFYAGTTCGVFAISFAISVGCKNIFLLGYDCYADEKGRTHWFQQEVDLKEKRSDSRDYYYGVGLNKEGTLNASGMNNTPKMNNEFDVFLQEKDVNIYNVSEQSRINSFPKISYNTFFEKLKSTKEIKQDEVRQYLKTMYLEGHKCP